MWDEGFCDALAERGHFVVRYDNRDVGLSTKFDAAGIPNVMRADAPERRRRRRSRCPTRSTTWPTTPRACSTRSASTRAHVCGASMGGMIAQTVAIRHSRRVRSLVSIMSSTGDPGLPQAKPEAMAVLTGAAAARTARAASTQRCARGARSAARASRSTRRRSASAPRVLFDRSFYPQGTARQMAAIMAHGSRAEKLRAVSSADARDPRRRRPARPDRRRPPTPRSRSRAPSCS